MTVFVCITALYIYIYAVCKAHAPNHTVISELSGYIIILNVISHSSIFVKKYLSLFSFNLKHFLEHFSF